MNIEGDRIVDPGNTHKAFRIRRRGIGPDKLRRRVVRGEGLDHVTGVAPTPAAARRFFDSRFVNADDGE